MFWLRNKNIIILINWKKNSVDFDKQASPEVSWSGPTRYSKVGKEYTIMHTVGETGGGGGG